MIQQSSRGGSSDDVVKCVTNSLCEDDFSLPSQPQTLSAYPSRLHAPAVRARSCSESLARGTGRPQAGTGSMESFAYVSKGGRLTPQVGRPSASLAGRTESATLMEGSCVSEDGTRRCSSKTESLLRPEYQSNNPFVLLKYIYKTRQITGHEYKVLSFYLFVISVAYNLIVYWLAFAVIVQNTQVTDANKNVLVYVSAAVLLHLILQILVSGGYCVYNHKRPLPKSRMVIHMTLCTVLALVVPCMTYLIMLCNLRIVQFGWKYTPLVVMCIGQLVLNVLIGLQVCRQRVIYHLFVESLYTPTLSTHIYEYTLGAILVLAVLCLVPFVFITLHYGESAAMWIPLIPCLEELILVFVLMYYTYISRNVKESFSDWRANMRVGAVITSATILNYVLSVHVLAPNTLDLVSPTNVAYIILPMYLTLFTLGVCLLDIFLMITLITAFQLNIQGTLDPSHTVLNGWEKVVAEEDRNKGTDSLTMSNCIFVQNQSNMNMGRRVSMSSTTPTVHEEPHGPDGSVLGPINSGDGKTLNPRGRAVTSSLEAGVNRHGGGGDCGEGSSCSKNRIREVINRNKSEGECRCMCRNKGSYCTLNCHQHCHSYDDIIRGPTSRECDPQRVNDKCKPTNEQRKPCADNAACIREGCVTANNIVSSTNGTPIHRGSTTSNGSSSMHSLVRCGGKSRSQDDPDGCAEACGDSTASGPPHSERCKGGVSNSECMLSYKESTSSNGTIHSVVRIGGSQSIEFMRAADNSVDTSVIYEDQETTSGVSNPMEPVISDKGT
ncbi:hypothetical protein SARC_12378 [Sphaeroforma arctica JP610]|uniref:Uncharacterized protein n=1 Tax=Sphaeroforma arctica JP610 TaxID=667725 RepID=A0A0L0FED0_9EUKA|nr:hypothetical protein SARC_12378 [Sphaeroforma arctica JP610]KNC75090.1 hypothetical protein SARC_12378 [Sphaeroforma arctica JP610]|eukprot:XP_014148992.1 hypothetical protein SARC_12378 [Sphaeroforma arctica JP610]